MTHEKTDPVWTPRSALRIWASHPVISLILIVFMVSIVRITINNGDYFVFYWKAANRLLHGHHFYTGLSEGTPQFPPWWIWAFVPFAYLPLVVAKWIWGIGSALCLYAITGLLVRQGVRAWIIGLSVLLFGAVFNAHARMGQPGLLLLWVGLWGERTYGTRAFTPLAVLFSLRISTLFSLLGLGPLSLFRKALGFLIAAAVWIVLLIPVVLLTKISPRLLMQEWALALQAESMPVRTQDLGSFLGRILSATDYRFYFVAAFVLMIGIGLVWSRLSKRLRPHERWWGWLALAPVVHPLAHSHHFVMAFPLAALALDRAYSTRYRRLKVVAFVAVFALTIASSTVFGSFGQAMEWISVRSFGVLACLWVLLASRPLRK